MGNEVATMRERWIKRRPDPLNWVLKAYYRLYILYASQRAINIAAEVANTVIQGITHGVIQIKSRGDFISLINSTEELRLTYYQNILFYNMQADFWVACPGHIPLPHISRDKTMNYNFDVKNPFVGLYKINRFISGILEQMTSSRFLQIGH
jgi:hypothetical protein